MDFINNNQYLHGDTVNSLINGTDPTCAEKSNVQDADRLSDQDVKDFLAATSENEVDDPHILRCAQAKDLAEVYQRMTQKTISDFLNYVEVAVNKENEAREQERLENEKKTEYVHTLAVTTALKKAIEYFSKSHPIVITPSRANTVRLQPLYTYGIPEDVTLNSVISADEIRAIAKKSHHFVLLDDKVDPKVSVCLELAINMPKNEQ